MSETLTAALLLPIVATLLDPPARAWLVFALGAASGLLFVRPNAGAAAGALAALAFGQTRRWKALVGFGAAAAVVVAPVWVLTSPTDNDKLRGLGTALTWASASTGGRMPSGFRSQEAPKRRANSYGGCSTGSLSSSCMSTRRHARRAFESLAREFCEVPNVRVLRERRVWWAGFSQVTTTLSMVSLALQIVRFRLRPSLSASDMVVRDLSEFDSLPEVAAGADFIDITPVPPEWSVRFRYYYLLKGIACRVRGSICTSCSRRAQRAAWGSSPTTTRTRAENGVSCVDTAEDDLRVLACSPGGVPSRSLLPVRGLP